MNTTLHDHGPAAGIYLIRDAGNGHVYVGSASKFSARVRSHMKDLRAGRHANPGLSAAFAADPSRLTFEVVAIISDETQRLETERIAIRGLIGPGCYNATVRSPPSHLGAKRSVEHKAAIAASNRKRVGKVMTAETRARMSAAKVGVKKSPAHAAALSAMLQAAHRRIKGQS